MGIVFEWDPLKFVNFLKACARAIRCISFYFIKNLKHAWWYQCTYSTNLQLLQSILCRLYIAWILSNVEIIKRNTIFIQKKSFLDNMQLQLRPLMPGKVNKKKIRNKIKSSKLLNWGKHLVALLLNFSLFIASILLCYSSNFRKIQHLHRFCKCYFFLQDW